MVRRGHTDTKHSDLNSLLCYSFSRKAHHKSNLLLYVSRCFKSKHYITSNGTGGHECIREEEVVGYSNAVRPINLSIFHSRTHSLNQSIGQTTHPSSCVSWHYMSLRSHYRLLRNTSNTHARVHSRTQWITLSCFLLAADYYYYYWHYYTHSSPNNFSFHIFNLL